MHERRKKERSDLDSTLLFNRRLAWVGLLRYAELEHQASSPSTHDPPVRPPPPSSHPHPVSFRARHGHLVGCPPAPVRRCLVCPIRVDAGFAPSHLGCLQGTSARLTPLWDVGNC